MKVGWGEGGIYYVHLNLHQGNAHYAPSISVIIFLSISISQGKHFIFTSSPAFVLRMHRWNEVIASLLIPSAGGLLCKSQLIGSLAALRSSSARHNQPIEEPDRLENCRR